MVIFLSFLLNTFAWADLPVLQNGDLIFHQSQSAQAPALAEATGSPWTHVGILMRQGREWKVIEAASGVTVTPLAQFVARGAHQAFVIRRLKDWDTRLDDAGVAALQRELRAHLGEPYDFFFEWSDERLYCSELVWKAYQRALGIEVGSMQKFKELKLDGPHVTELIKKRLGAIGRELNVEEPVVTPVSQLEDPDFTTVVSRP